MISKVLFSEVFNQFIFISLVINTIILSLDGIFNEKSKMGQILNVLNTIFTLIFTFEIVLKLIYNGLTSNFFTFYFYYFL